MKIDIYSHIIPRKYLDAVYKRQPQRMRSYEFARTAWNIDERLQIMDKYEDLVQVLTPTGPPVEQIAEPKEASELAKLYNDEMAELVAKYPGRFIAAVACLPMNDIDAAIEETHRAITELGFKGILIHTPIYDGSVTVTKPLDLSQLMPLYKIVSSYNLPIWIHPSRSPSMTDYTTEDESKYRIWHILGWPYETSVAMTRLVFSGVLERCPNLKLITHHCGAMVPYLADRIISQYELAEIRPWETELVEKLSRPPIEYYRMFYADTALHGNTPALMCAYAFFGADHILFGTDVPYDAEQGTKTLRDTINAIDQMSIPDLEKQKIFQDNAKTLLNMK